jgi:hypothetical protein
MIVLIPLSRFRITYQIAAGRPYSRFEQLVLRAIEEGATDVAALEGIFQIHPRLVIEALVTLIQAGWLAIDAANRAGLVLSADGRQALHAGSVPRTLVAETKACTAVMERMTGGLLPNSEIQYASSKELGGVWKNTLRLRAEVTDNRLDQGQVQHLIPRRKSEWLRWVGPIDLDSQGSHWLPVDVDLHSGTMVGIPEAWSARLGPLVIEEAKRFADSQDAAVLNADRYYEAATGVRRREEESSDLDSPKRPAAWSLTRVDPDDFLVGSSAHRGYLLAAISRAASALVIASAFMTVRCLETLEDSLRDALRRGVNLDLMWGYSSGDSTSDKAAIEWLRRVAYSAKQSGFVGKLRFNPAPSGAHAKIVMFDSPRGQFEGCVGSFNWLSALAQGQAAADSIELSMRLHDSVVLTTLARCVAGLWNEIESDRLGSTSDRWMRFASELEEGDVVDRGVAGREREVNAQVRLVLDREHEALLREWSSSTKEALLIVSHGLGLAAGNRLVRLGSAGRRASFDCLVAYGETSLDEEQIGVIGRDVEQQGGRLVRIPKLHAKALLSDRSACITSYNFLSTDPFGKLVQARELGVALEGAPVDWLRHEVMGLIAPSESDALPGQNRPQ